MQDKNTQDVNLILNRLKSALNIKEDSTLAERIGVKNNTLSNWKSRNSINYDQLFTLCESEGLNTNWVISGAGKSRISQEISNAIEVSLPLLPIEAMAGFGNGDIQIKDTDIQEHYYVPEFKNIADFLIRISGNSMYPKYSSGDIIACKIIKEATFFQWGKVYLMDTTQGPIIKRLFPGSNETKILCKSDNIEFPAFEISYKLDVRSFALVIGIIRLD